MKKLVIFTLLALTIVLITGCTEDKGEEVITPNVQIPNPFTDEDSLLAVQDKAGFELTLPENFNGCVSYHYRAMADQMIEIICLDGNGNETARIRKAVESGDIENANKMLGRYFSYDFEVVTGDRIGAKVLGFPTINQIFPDDHIVPKSGVYASLTEVDGKIYPSMTNIGKRPTVGGEQLRSETCIIGFSGDLYGTNTPVGLISYIRDEEKFPSLEALSAQLKKDSEKAEKIFNEVFR